MEKAGTYTLWINTKRFGKRLAGLQPNAMAKLVGSPSYPSVKGIVSFHKSTEGILAAAQVYGLTAVCTGK